MQLLKQHYGEVVAPAVEASGVESASCATGLAALTRAVEDRATAGLAAALACLAQQASHTLLPLVLAFVLLCSIRWAALQPRPPRFWHCLTNKGARRNAPCSHAHFRVMTITVHCCRAISEFAGYVCSI